jgi:hypothetical protein
VQRKIQWPVLVMPPGHQVMPRQSRQEAHVFDGPVAPDSPKDLLGSITLLGSAHLPIESFRTIANGTPRLPGSLDDAAGRLN